MHHQRVRRSGDPPDRGEVLARVVADVGIEVRPDRQGAGVAEPDGVTVGIGFRERPGADGAAGASAVVDHDLLAERLTELVADERMTMVVLPPGGNGMISVIGRSG